MISSLSNKQIWIAAIVINILVAFFSSGFHHFDEHFQIIEFMNYKINGDTDRSMAWEFFKQIRPWFQPYLYYFIDAPIRFFEMSPFFRAFILRLFTALFALFASYQVFKKVLSHWFEEVKHKKVALFIFLLTWFIPYINVRASSEGTSISFFLLGLAYCLPNKKNSDFIWAGLFFGLSYLCRFQMGLPVAVIWFWALFTKRWSLKCLSLFSASIIFCFIFGALIDRAGYGNWTFPLYNYFKANFLDGVLKHMGESPWYKYLEWSLIKPIPPISLILLIGVFKFWWNERKSEKSWLVWITFSFFIFHSCIGHKELRFIFLCGYFAPIMSYWVLKKMPPKWLLLLNAILIIISMKPANRMIPLYKVLYNSSIDTLYYVEEDPMKLVGLPLHFYMKNGLKRIKLGESSPIGKYVFTKRYDSTENFLNKDCKNLYLNYPKDIFKYESLKKLLKKSKVMGIFYCRDNHE